MENRSEAPKSSYPHNGIGAWDVESAEPIRSGAKASVIGEGTGLMQPMDFPGSQRATCRQGTVNESSEPLAGRLGVAVRTHSEGTQYKPCR